MSLSLYDLNSGKADRGLATNIQHGLMSAQDKDKLNRIESNANYYVHPLTHPTTMITGLAAVATTGSYNDLLDRPTGIDNADTVDGKHATDFTPVTHVGSGGTSHVAVTTTENGFMLANDKIKLDGITAGAKLVQPSLINGNIKIDGIETTIYNHPNNHGNITITGAIGAESLKPIITGVNGILQAGSFGTDIGTFCQGNDPRLSDARIPLAHTHGNISNLGMVGSTEDLAIMTGINGIIQAGVLPIKAGGTGATTTAQILSNLGIIATSTEINHLSGSTSNIQEQLSTLAANSGKGGITEVDISKILYHSNVCANSSFELFDSNLIPYYWSTIATVSQDSNFDGHYSLKLLPTQTAIQTMDGTIGLWDPSWWAWTPNTRFSFRIKAADITGKVKVEVLNASNIAQNLTYRIYDNETEQWNVISEITFIEFMSGASWTDAFRTFTAQCPEPGYYKLKFTNSGNIDIYIDTITIEGDNDTNWPSLYKPGIKSSGAADINGHRLFMTSFDPGDIAEDGDVWINIG